MCTVSWVHQPDGYHLLCNRDEKRSRGRAFAPSVFVRGGVRYISPVDVDFGGTWLSVNEYGVSLCLLNGDRAASTVDPRRSRGLLLRELAWAESSAECALWLRQIDLNPFAPFTLLVLEPGQAAGLAHWSGQNLTLDPSGDSHMPLTSSSYDAAGVRQSRLDEFARCAGSAERPDPALLYWFHSSHGQSPDAYSTCMHRDDAETVSFSWVIVNRDTIRFLYSPDAPCRSSPSEQQILPRAA